MRNIDHRFPSIHAMERHAERRIPGFAYSFLQGGIGVESCLRRNRSALDQVLFSPRYIADESFVPDMSAQVARMQFPIPFAPGPIGLSGLMWPRAVELVAGAAVKHGSPVGLSTFATSSIEDVAAIAGDKLWFQLYCTRDEAIENDLIDRAHAAGCRTLIVTVDIPTNTRRERSIASGISVPPTFGRATVRDMLARPVWCCATLRSGVPAFRNLERYVPRGASFAERGAFLENLVDVQVTASKLEKIRERWPGALMVKGVLSCDDAVRVREIGADAIVVSNHGGRQLDAAPAAPTVLGKIRAAVGDVYPIVADGGVRSGLDVARMFACGADFVLMGRAFVYAVACAGRKGVEHAFNVLTQELRQTMIQVGCPTLKEFAGFRYES